MALSFPLPLADFFTGLRVSVSSLSLTSGRVVSRTRGGEQISAEVSTRIWRGSLSLAPRYHGQADAVTAKLAMLEGAAASFLIAPPHRAGPILDPTGAGLEGYTPSIMSVASNNRELRLAGLPEGYALSAGDYLGFTYGSNPTRYALHQIVTGGVANSSGQSPQIEVIPHIRAGAMVGAAVSLVRPTIKAVITSAGYGEHRPVIHQGLSLDFVQTLG